MSVTGAEPLLPEDQGSDPLGKLGLRLRVLISTHFIVDYFAFVIVALMPLFTARLALTDVHKATLFAAGSICSGLVQPVVAWWSDRANSRLLGIGGLALGGVCVSLFGVAQSFEHLLALQIVSTIGVGAFHPVAAAAMGELSSRRRLLGVAAFFLAGMLGGVAGNLLSPLYVRWAGRALAGVGDETTMGLRALGMFALVGIGAAVALTWAIRAVPHRAHDAHERHGALEIRDRAVRWAAVGLLYLGNVIRFIVNIALVYLFEAWAEHRTLAGAGATILSDELGLKASTLNGPLQGAMQVGMGGCGILVGIFVGVRHEKAALVLVPLIGAAGLFAFPLVTEIGGLAAVGAALGISVLAGMGFGGAMPVAIAMAQRLLPHRTGLASGLMMGGAWSFGAIGPFLARALEHRLGLDPAFQVIAGLLLGAGVLALFLPGRTVRESAP